MWCKPDMRPQLPGIAQRKPCFKHSLLTHSFHCLNIISLCGCYVWSTDADSTEAQITNINGKISRYEHFNDVICKKQTTETHIDLDVCL